VLTVVLPEHVPVAAAVPRVEVETS
jgi:hypothetical protein